jgi:hypothetical protein
VSSDQSCANEGYGIFPTDGQPAGFDKCRIESPSAFQTLQRGKRKTANFRIVGGRSGSVRKAWRVAGDTTNSGEVNAFFADSSPCHAVAWFAAKSSSNVKSTAMRVGFAIRSAVDKLFRDGLQQRTLFVG